MRITELLKSSFRTWKQAPWLFLIIGAVQVAAAILQIYSQNSMKNSMATELHFWPGYILIVVEYLMVMLATVSAVCVANIALLAGGGEKITGAQSMEAISAALRKPPVQAAVGFLLALQTITTFSFLATSNAYVTMGINIALFLITMLEAFLVQIVVISDATWMEAIKKSPVILGREWALLLQLWIVAIFMVLLSIVTFGILMFFAAPIYEIALTRIARAHITA
jgi:hypothetical protein